VDTPDPHELLGVAPGASPDEVRRAYRRAARQLHPDAAGGGNAALFRLVTAAYEQLLAGDSAPPAPVPAPPPPEPEEVRWDDLTTTATTAPTPPPAPRQVAPERSRFALIAAVVAGFVASARRSGEAVGEITAGGRILIVLPGTGLLWFLVWTIPTAVIGQFVPSIIVNVIGLVWLVWCANAWWATWGAVFANRRRLSLWERIRGDGRE